MFEKNFGKKIFSIFGKTSNYYYYYYYFNIETKSYRDQTTN